MLIFLIDINLHIFKSADLSSQVKLSFIVIPLYVGTYSGTKCHASLLSRILSMHSLLLMDMDSWNLLY